MGLFSGGNSRSESITDASGIQSGGSVTRLQDSSLTEDNSYVDASRVVNSTALTDASTVDNSYVDSSTTSTSISLTDQSTTNTASGAGAISADGSVTIYSTDAAIARDSLDTAASIIGAQLQAQQDYNRLAMGSQREFQSLAMGDLNASRSVMLADADRARQADGGKSEKIILYALGAVALLGIAFAWAGKRK